MSRLIDIAEAVKTELNDGSFTLDFSATRKYVPELEQKNMGSTIHITVIPVAIAIESASRSDCQYTARVDIAVQKRVDESSNTAVDVMIDLVEEIEEFFRLRRLTEYTNAIWQSTVNDPVYSIEHLQDMRVFTSILQMEFRVIE